MKFKIDFDNLLNTDLHMHTNFSDGKDSPSDMLKSAVKKGMKVVGISDHSYTFFDESYCIQREQIEDYNITVFSLAQKCAQLKDNPRLSKALGTDDIRLWAGIEQDYYSNEPTDCYDYVIGSVHYIRINRDGRDVVPGCHAYMNHIYIPVDENPEILLNAAESYYGGDIYSLIEDYYLIVSDVVNRTNCDIIGHFDLISKFNEDGRLFDPANPRYIAAWKKAADALLYSGRIFEINTGAISRGYRTCAYPSAEQISYIKENGGRFIYSSDAHNKENIAFHFELLQQLDF